MYRKMLFKLRRPDFRASKKTTAKALRLAGIARLTIELNKIETDRVNLHEYYTQLLTEIQQNLDRIDQIDAELLEADYNEPELKTEQNWLFADLETIGQLLKSSEYKLALTTEYKVKIEAMIAGLKK
jgi:hypothetical protein